MDEKRKDAESWVAYQECLADEDPHYEQYCSFNPFVKWLFNKRFKIIYKVFQ